MKRKQFLACLVCNQCVPPCPVASNSHYNTERRIDGEGRCEGLKDSDLSISKTVQNNQSGELVNAKMYFASKVERNHKAR